MGDIEHAAEWPPAPFDDSHYFPCGLPGCFSCRYPQLLRHTATQRSLWYCRYKGQMAVVVLLKFKNKSIFMEHITLITSIHINKHPAEFISDYKMRKQHNLRKLYGREKGLPLYPPLLQHHRPLLLLHPAARLRRAPPTDPVATAARQPHPGALLCWGSEVPGGEPGSRQMGHLLL